MTVSLYGGRLSDSLHGLVTHIIVSRDDTARYQLILQRLRLLREDVRCLSWCEKRVVWPEWVSDCVAEETLIVPPLAKHVAHLQQQEEEEDESGTTSAAAVATVGASDE